VARIESQIPVASRDIRSLCVSYLAITTASATCLVVDELAIARGCAFNARRVDPNTAPSLPRCWTATRSSAAADASKHYRQQRLGGENGLEGTLSGSDNIGTARSTSHPDETVFAIMRTIRIQRFVTGVTWLAESSARHLGKRTRANGGGSIRAHRAVLEKLDHACRSDYSGNRVRRGGRSLLRRREEPAGGEESKKEPKERLRKTGLDFG